MVIIITRAYEVPVPTTYIHDTIIYVLMCVDEPINGGEANTISLRREIPIIDVNDNYPTFSNAQYSFSIKETARVGSIVYEKITIEDGDFGLNSLVNLFCVQSLDCRTFAVSLQIVSSFAIRNPPSMKRLIHARLFLYNVDVRRILQS